MVRRDPALCHTSYQSTKRFPHACPRRCVPLRGRLLPMQSSPLGAMFLNGILETQHSLRIPLSISVSKTVELQNYSEDDSYVYLFCVSTAAGLVINLCNKISHIMSSHARTLPPLVSPYVCRQRFIMYRMRTSLATQTLKGALWAIYGQI